ncbi:MAG: carbonic anhydrase [Patescibacteria group bacterium]
MHKSKVLFISCSDPRLRPWNERKMAELGGPREVDPIIIPGPIPLLASRDFSTKFVTAWVVKLWTLHGFTRVVLTSHEDCGAVGGSEKFNGPKAEETVHREWLRQASAKLRKLLPQVTEFETIYVPLSEMMADPQD